MGRLSTKSDEELQKLYLLRVQSSVQSLTRQYVKLAKAWRSREHSMPQATKEAILAHIDKVVNAFNVEIAQADAPEDDKFRLMPDSEREKLLPKKVEKVAEKPKSETPKPIPTVKKQ